MRESLVAPALAPDATSRVARFFAHRRGGDVHVVILPNPPRPHRPVLEPETRPES